MDSVIDNQTQAPENRPGLQAQLSAIAVDIKLSHTLFAMPFALLGTCLASAAQAAVVQAQVAAQATAQASGGDSEVLARLPGWGQLALIILCMFFARTAAMTFNRWADKKVDADNDRTVRRAIPAGRVLSSTMFWATAVCAILFFAACGLFALFYENFWPLYLSPLVLAWLLGYSYTKRFTWLCHLYLGVALALSPVCAALAIYPAFLNEPDVWLLSAMVVGWVAGFDVIYAIQDLNADQQLGLYSIPSRLGLNTALWISRALHLGSIAMLWTLTLTSSWLNIIFMIAAVVATGLILLEQIIVWRSKIKHLNLVFFTLNGILSLVLGVAGVIDILLK